MKTTFVSLLDGYRRFVLLLIFLVLCISFSQPKAAAQTCSGSTYNVYRLESSCQPGGAGLVCTVTGYTGLSGNGFQGCYWSSGYCGAFASIWGAYGCDMGGPGGSCRDGVFIGGGQTGWFWDGCYVEGGYSTPGGSYGTPGGGYGTPYPGPYGYPYPAPPTSTPTPTPTPRPDLAVTVFSLTKTDGSIPPGSPPRFYTGEDICPYVTIKNQSPTGSVSSTNYTWTAFYKDRSLAPTLNLASDTDIYLRNGEFGANFAKNYGAASVGPSNSYYTYKDGSNSQRKCWTAAWPGGTAWVSLNYDHKATDSNYSNNIRSRDYDVSDPPTYSISGTVFRDLNKDGNYAGSSAEGVPIAVGYTVQVKDGATVLAQKVKSGNSSNSFSFNNLPGYPSKTYQVVITAINYTGTPNFFATFPSDASYDVTVGPGCKIVPSGGDGVCNGSNDVTSLNIGIDNNTTDDPLQYGLSGKVWYDTNRDGIRQTSESVYLGSVTVSVKQGTTSFPTGWFANGNPALSNWDTNPDNLRSGTYKITYTNPPAGYDITVPIGGTYTLSMDSTATTPFCKILPSSSGRTCTPGDTSIGGMDFGLAPKPTSTPTPTPTPIVGTLSVSGRVFVDTNQDGTYQVGENYNPPFSTVPVLTVTNKPDNNKITLTPNATPDGTYTITGMIDGQYTLAFTVPSGYIMTRPLPPQYSIVMAAADCAEAQFPPGATCTAATGNLTNVNFGITPQTTWMQSLGGDVRFDQGYTNPIPANSAASCPKNGTQAYALGTTGGSTTPGILFTGKTVPTVGSGLISSTTWQLSGSTYGQNYNPVNASSLRTSYDYVMTSIKQRGQSVQELTLVSGCNSLQACAPSSSIASGFYRTNGSLVLKGITITAGKKLVFLVNGSLIIQTPIDVPVGASVVFIVRDNIVVTSDIGVSNPPATCVPSGVIEGYYSAGKDFILSGANDCAASTDLMLPVEGSIVANAGLQGGKIVNNRKLCTNSAFPALTIRERPDMILNIPDILKVPTYTWQEVAP